MHDPLLIPAPAPGPLAAGPDRASSCAALGLLGFGAFFALPGTIIMFASIHDVAVGQATEDSLVTILGGGTFFLVGLGVAVVSWFFVRWAADQRARVAQNPDAPWMWERTWASRVIPSQTRRSVVGFWVLAVLWTVVSATPLVVVFQEDPDDLGMLLIVSIFPLIGVALLVAAAWRTVAHWRFGRATFELTTLPGVLGGTLAGRILIRLTLPPEATAELVLQSIDVVRRGSGRNRHVEEVVRWSAARTVRSAETAEAGSGLRAVPVDFTVPSDQEPSSATANARDHTWVLLLHADLPGANCNERFEVPVFRTIVSDESLTTAAVEALHVAPARLEAARAPARSSRIVVRTTPAGGREFWFPPARRVGAAIGWTVVSLVLGAVTGATVAFGAPWFATIVAGLFLALTLVSAMWLWGGSTRFTVDPAGVAVERGVFGVRRTRRYAREDVTGVALDVEGAQAERGVGSFSILATLRGGERIAVAHDVPGRTEAEWLVRQMRDALTGTAQL